MNYSCSMHNGCMLLHISPSWCFLSIVPVLYLIKDIFCTLCSHLVHFQMVNEHFILSQFIQLSYYKKICPPTQLF